MHECSNAKIRQEDKSVIIAISSAIWDGHWVTLDKSHTVSAIKSLRGSANWIARGNVLAFMDGGSYIPVSDLQNVDMYKKWGNQSFKLELGPATVTDALGLSHMVQNTADQQLTEFPLYISDIMPNSTFNARVTKPRLSSRHARLNVKRMPGNRLISLTWATTPNNRDWTGTT